MSLAGLAVSCLQSKDESAQCANDLIYLNNKRSFSFDVCVNRPPPAPIPGPKPNNKSLRPKPAFPSSQTPSSNSSLSSSSSSSYVPPYSAAGSGHPANNLMPNGRHHYSHPPSNASIPNPPATTGGFYSNGVGSVGVGNNHNSMSHSMPYHHQENRRGAPTLSPSSLPPTTATVTSVQSALNGFHYSFAASQANSLAPISPHHVGLPMPMTPFAANHCTTS